MQRFGRLFPLRAVLPSMLACLQPDWFTWMRPVIAPLPGVVKFRIGHELSGPALAGIWSRSPPEPDAAGARPGATPDPGVPGALAPPRERARKREMRLAGSPYRASPECRRPSDRLVWPPGFRL